MSNNKDSLGDRMKGYEEAVRTSLPRRLPIIIRVDGKAFHTYTRGCERPFDPKLQEVMNETAKALCKEIQGVQLAYIQSDEISLLLHNYKTFTTQPWFGNQIQKMVSVAAGTASAIFTSRSPTIFNEIKHAVFDARVFIVPTEDVCNYFIWRQQDTIRNSVQMLARSVFSHKECDSMSIVQLKEMLQARGRDWGGESEANRYGRIATYGVAGVNQWEPRWNVKAAPVFVENRDAINQHLIVEEQ